MAATISVQRSPFVTGSARSIEPLYIPTGDEFADYGTKLGVPGQFPFTRGVHPTMYRGRLWTMRQYAGFSTAEESNQRFKYLLSQGSTGLSVAFDLPTQIGLDSDDPFATGEVGRVGVAIDTLADMEALFRDIPLDKFSTSMTINATASILLAMYVVAAEKQGVTPDKLCGTIQNDPLKEYIARGTYRFPPRPSLRIVRDIFEYCTREMPVWNMISISGYHMREAGATAAQEIAFTLADAICYIQAAIDAGMDVDDFAPRIAFFFACHTDLFEEVAKFRAARRLYAKIMRDRFGARDARSQMLRFHTQTGGVTLSAQQVDNNIVRVALQSLAAVLGGTQSLHSNGKDEALALPTEENARTALRTQQIIAYESGVANTIDPLAGSFYVEKLTDELEAEATCYIDKIDRLGGMVAAIEQGYVQREIEEAAYQYGQSIERNERIIVGMNRFQADGEPEYESFVVPEEVATKQTERLKRVRRDRDIAAVDRTLNAIEEEVRGQANLMPLILNAVRAYASIGEICASLQRAFGNCSEYCETFRTNGPPAFFSGGM